MAHWKQQGYNQDYNNYGYEVGTGYDGYSEGYGDYGYDGSYNEYQQQQEYGYGQHHRGGGGGYGGRGGGGYGGGGGGGGYGRRGGGGYGEGRWNKGGGYGGGNRRFDDRQKPGGKRNFRDQQSSAPKPRKPKSNAEYYFENGLRKVYPYFFTFYTNAQKRWEDRTILEVYCDDYPNNTKENYEKAIEKGTILVNEQRVPVDYVLKLGDAITSKTHRHEDPVLDLPIDIIHEDRELLVVNKPPGIPCNPSGRFKANSVSSILENDLKMPYLKNMYHLDWQCSGIMVFAKNSRKMSDLENLIHNGQVHKQFVARVVGEFPLGKITVDNPQESVTHKLSLWRISSNGRPSKTTFERISYNGKSSVVKCVPEVGRTSHQIRVHLQYMGHPIINDSLYNTEAWGPNKGKGGVYNRPMEEVIEQLSGLSKVCTIGELLDEENPLLAMKAEKEAADEAKKEEEERLAQEKKEEEERIAQEKKEAAEKEAEARKAAGETVDTGEEKMAEEETENKDGEAEEKSAEAGVEKSESGQEGVTDMDTSENSEPQAKRVKTDSEEKDDTKTDDKDDDDDDDDDDDKPQVTYSRYKTRGQIFVVKHKPFDLDKWKPAEDCAECLKKYVDPKPEALQLYLHAQMFESPEWQYYAKLPDWAGEDWKEPEESEG